MTDDKHFPRLPLHESTIDPNPIAQFRRWYDEAIAAGVPMPDATTLATDGKPSVRIVLLKQVDESGFFFFTNYESRKGREIERSANVGLLFYWSALDRQVRIDGVAERNSARESGAYFQTRSRESQLGTWASTQSELLRDRDELEQSYIHHQARYSDREIPCPPYWGGYRIRPTSNEFWQSRSARLHDRILYTLHTDGEWEIRRLAP